MRHSFDCCRVYKGQEFSGQWSDMWWRCWFVIGPSGCRSCSGCESGTGLAVHWRAWYRWLPGPTGEVPCHKASPGLQSLPGPDPNTWGNAYYKTHEVFQHEDSIVRPYAEPLALRRARTGQCPLPTWPVMLLIHQASHHNSCRHGIQDGEEPNPDHKLLQLVCLCAALFNNATDPEEWNESGQKEEGASEEVDDQRCQYKAT